MKVLQINAVYGISSTGRTSSELSEELVSRGHTCITAYGEKKSDYPNSYYIGNTLDHKIHALMSRISGLQGYFSHLPTWRLLKFMDKYKPEIVHLRNLHGNFINIPMLLSYLSRNDIATVVTLHDCFFFTGKCYYYTNNQCYKWLQSCGDCNFIHKSGPTSWLFDWTKKMLLDKKQLFSSIKRLAIIGVSDWVSEEARKSIVFRRSSSIMRIYNWIDFNNFQYVENDFKKVIGIENKHMILGVSSAWSRAKGLEDFITLAGKLSRDYYIVLVGQLDQSDLPSNIISIPQTENVKELASIYSAADVFFNPSVEETFGKVTAEALSCGTPVVVYNVTSCPELVGDKCGFVCELGNIDEALQKIHIIIKDGKENYSPHCIDFAHKKFDKLKNINDYLNLYESLIKLV